MKKMKVFLCMICTALLLSPLTGCGSKGYSGDGDYYRRDPWYYDHYYRSRVHHHHHRSHVHRPGDRPDRPRPPRPPKPPNRPMPRPSHPIAR